MSNYKLEENEKKTKKLFSFLSKKTESSILPDNSIPQQNKEQNKCENCKKKYNLFKCIKCLHYFCSKCIKQLIYYKRRRIKRNEFICENCGKNDIFREKKNIHNLFCFICGAFIGEKNKYEYLVTPEQKAEFENELIDKCFIYNEKLKENQNENNGIEIIRICIKCNLFYSELINRVLNKKSDSFDMNNMDEDILNNIFNKKNELHFLDTLLKNDNNNNNYKNNSLQEMKNILRNHKNNQNLMEECMNNYNIKDLLEVDNLIYKDFFNKDSFKKYCEANELLNKTNISRNNNNINFFNNKSNNQNINNFFNPNNNQNSSDMNILNNFSNYITSLNKNTPDLMSYSQINNENKFNSQNIPQNLVNNIFNQGFNTKNNKLNDLNEPFKYKENPNDKKNAKKENENMNGNPEEKENNNDTKHLYYFIYKMRNALNQITEYLSIFQNNNNDYNNTVLNDVESLTIIFSKIISKMKYDKNNENNNGNNTDKENNSQEKINFTKEINKNIDKEKENDVNDSKKDLNVTENNKDKDNIDNIENNIIVSNDNKNIIGVIEQNNLGEKKKNNIDVNNIINNDIKNIENKDCNEKINNQNEIKDNNKENEVKKDMNENGNKINEENNDKKAINENKKKFEDDEEEEDEDEESLDTYLDFILAINDSFKMKLKTMKIYNDLKNLFFKLLFESIEGILVKMLEIASEDPFKSQLKALKKIKKPDPPLNPNNTCPYDNSSKLNMNTLKNNIPYPNFFNQPLPPLNLPNFNIMSNKINENIPCNNYFPIGNFFNMNNNDNKNSKENV